MSQTLGEKLREAREERGLSIGEVAEQTRISSLYLESIERDDYKPLPGGIFNKGFVKSYAKFVGLDENEAVQEYSRIVTKTEGLEDKELRVYRSEVLTDDNVANSMIPTLIFAGIILALITGGVLFLLNYLQTQPSEPAANTNVNANRTGTVPTPTPAPSFNEIRIEFTPTAEAISLTSVVDGKQISEVVPAGTPKVITASESVRLSYYRGFFDKVALKLNGKAIEPPPAPARGSSVTFTIDKANAEAIYTAGRFVQPGETTPSPTVTTPAPTPTAVPTATVSTSPVTTPGLSPGPVIRGNTATPARTATPAVRTTPLARTTPAATPTP
ncbi:MAG: helix-turn-helix domain-containing protein [Acidobacteria bacterium]|nr:helix-turn-helix domain-containing protein [Acidobacteriota bacterium]